MLEVLIVVVLAGLGLGALYLARPKRTLTTEIEIAAPPERVWAVLTDFASHPEWNPFIGKIAGALHEGARLEVAIQPGGGKGSTFRPKLLRVDPARELRWLGKLPIPGLFDGEHYFLLEPVDMGTRFTHGEKFAGMLLWVFDPRHLRPDFEAMNTALKARAEAG